MPAYAPAPGPFAADPLASLAFEPPVAADASEPVVVPLPLDVLGLGPVVDAPLDWLVEWAELLASLALLVVLAALPVVLAALPIVLASLPVVLASLFVVLATDAGTDVVVAPEPAAGASRTTSKKSRRSDWPWFVIVRVCAPSETVLL